MGRKEKIQPTEQPFWPLPPMSSTCPQKNRIEKHHFQASPSPKVGLSSRLPPRSCFCFFSYNLPSLRIYQTLCVVLIRRKTMMEMKTWLTPLPPRNSWFPLRQCPYSPGQMDWGKAVIFGGLIGKLLKIQQNSPYLRGPPFKAFHLILY